ncbi:CoB--CoM heterodisulfide reductase iron-sulfur subunit B family protein, partial [bacterium]|nr:CoB--CoM heterodisulfide reductase iron-sulfur subunit B family protein [bacterium]
CSLHSTGKEYGESVEVVSKALGLNLHELNDWSCCGATSAHSTNFELSVALPARNLAIADQKGLDIMIPCAACYNRFKGAQHKLNNKASLRESITATLDDEYSGKTAVRSPIEIFHQDIGLETLKGRVVKELGGLKPVSYYGCLWLRPSDVCDFEDAENPVMLDEIITSLGAESRNWSFKTDCCGGSLTVSKTDLVKNMVSRLMSMAKEAGANCIVTACPLCMANLDMRAQGEDALPTFYFTELMALAMGLKGPQNWFGLHNIDPMPLISSLKLV